MPFSGSAAEGGISSAEGSGATVQGYAPLLPIPSPSPDLCPSFSPLPPQETDATLDALLAMQGSASASGGHSRDHVLAELAADIQRRVPLPFDIEAAR